MRISLITPSYQQAEFLKETLDSVGGQSYEGVEHIVVDGGSTDGSKDIIENRQNNLHWWVSEPDDGQSDAINKGLEHASGYVFNWLNSDDLLTKDALNIVAEAFMGDPDLIVLGGRIIHRDPDGEKLFELQTDASDPANLFIDHAVLQPATFFRTSVVKELGGVEEKLRYVMDYELWLQVIFAHGTEHVRFIPDALAIFRLHEDSKTVTSHESFLSEMASVLWKLARITGNEELSDILSMGYHIRTDLRKIQRAGKQHEAIVKRMIVHFLLKWNSSISDKSEFRMMKSLIEFIDKYSIPVKRTQASRVQKLKTGLSVANWPLYRIKRKVVG